jgi:hypothetical protein
MNSLDPIRQYVADLACRLSSSNKPSERILCEVEDHLRQRVDQLLAAGWDQLQAEREAIARFGTTGRLADQFQRQPPLPCEEMIMIRRSLSFLVLLTSAYAALLVIFALLNEPTAIFSYVKLAFASIVVGCGALILHWQWTSRQLGKIGRWTVFICALGLIEIGSANIVWTVHLGLVTGDWENYGFVGGVLISLLGGLVAICLAFPDFLETKHDPQPLA